MIDNEIVMLADTPLTEKPGIVVGYRANGMPIYNIAGGSKDVVVGDSDDDDDDSSVLEDVASVDDTGDEEDEDSWTPPSREDYLKLVEGKKKADSEAAARKRYLREAGIDPKTGKKVEKPTVNLDDEDDDDTDLSAKDEKTSFDREKFEQKAQRVLERETLKAESRGRSSAYTLIYEVPAALEDAGWNGKNLPRMIKLLELDGLNIDEDGVDAEQLTSQVSELKKDFPEFFKRQRMKEAAKEVADTAAVGGGSKQAPASEEDLDWKAKMKLQLRQGK